MDWTSENLAFESATKLTAAIKKKEISSRELLDVYLDRVERLNGPLNAVINLDADRAREAAHAADEATASGTQTGRLHGLPMTIKDCFDVAGMRTTVGDPRYEDNVPTADAPLVRRMREEGAVFFGRTNVPLRLGDLQTENEVFGPTVNPWGTELTPGGSSGGAGAALAAGLTGLEISGDFGGSTRVPASHCGVYGLKATFGIIPCTGMLPMPPGHFSEIDMETPGPMGRAVDDLELGLDVLAGPEGHIGDGWKLDLPGATEVRSLEDVRVGLWFNDEGYPTDSAVVQVLERAAATLSDAGLKVDDSPPPGTLTEVMEIFEPLAFAVIGALTPESELAATAEDPLLQPSYRTWFWTNERRAELRSRWAAYFDQVDLLLAPCCVVAAHPHSPIPFADRTLEIDGSERPYIDVMAWSAPANALYFPGASVPAGQTEDGRPVGLQVMGGHYKDRKVLQAARLIDDVLGGFKRPVGY